MPSRRGGSDAAAGGGLDLHRHQALVAQAIDDLGFVGGLELAGGDVAGGVDRPVSYSAISDPPADVQPDEHASALPQPVTSFRA